MSAGSLLLAFDFDGTLAPICDDPSRAYLSRAAAVFLEQASQIEGVVVAVLSGRDFDDLSRRVRLTNAYLIASHGLEIRAPGGILIRDTPPLAASIPAELRSEIGASGLRLESKKHGVAVHWRGVPYEAVEPLIDLFRAWAGSAHLDLIEGRCVVEARYPGAGKEDALRWLFRATGAERVVYAGDDITDFGALRFAGECGRALFVASSERIPPPGVTVVQSFRELVHLVRQEVMI
ncbi:MAG TPA: trehalose-phosphatase [Thermoanaerobaculia bacterium]|nr:trehalose-phosphatase [Thermoanaerobaculia bacterium]